MEVRRVEGSLGLADALAVRRRVFVEEQDVPVHLEVDGHESSATHFVAYEDGRPIGAARLRPYADEAAKLERVAVLPSERGTGVGRALVAAVEAAASERFDQVVLHAQEPVVAFYERLGYQVTSEPFEEAGIDHREMRKRL